MASTTSRTPPQQTDSLLDRIGRFLNPEMPGVSLGMPPVGAPVTALAQAPSFISGLMSRAGQFHGRPPITSPATYGAKQTLRQALPRGGAQVARGAQAAETGLTQAAHPVDQWIQAVRQTPGNAGPVNWPTMPAFSSAMKGPVPPPPPATASLPAAGSTATAQGPGTGLNLLSKFSRGQKLGLGGAFGVGVLGGLLSGDDGQPSWGKDFSAEIPTPPPQAVQPPPEVPASGFPAEIPTPPPQAPLPPPEVPPSVYQAQKGNTLSGIAKNAGISLDDLLGANPEIQNPDRIDIGQAITLPQGVNAPEAFAGPGFSVAPKGPPAPPLPLHGGQGGGTANLDAIIQKLLADEEAAKTRGKVTGRVMPGRAPKP